MISGKELAKRLGVASATLCQATSNAHLCRGHTVSAWAVRSPSGRVIGYEVPAYVAATLTPSLPLVRVNPSPSGDGQSKEASLPPFGKVPSVLPPSGDGQSKEASLPPFGEVPSVLPPSGDGQSKEASLPRFGEVPSVLPPSQDYFKPVAAASAAHVVTKALERDNPSGRMVTTTVAVAGAALTGYHIAGKEGALVGAGLSLCVAWLVYRPQGEPSSSQPVLRRPAPQPAVLSPPRPPIRVGHASTPRSCALMLGSGAPGSDRGGPVVEAQVGRPITVIGW